MDSRDVPSRNPLTYCRLCLSQVNALTVLDSTDAGNHSPHKDLLQKLFHYLKVSLNVDEDYPCAICGICTSRVHDFHEFRRTVVQNHNAVRSFRRTFGDEISLPPLEEEEEEGTLIEIVDDVPSPPPAVVKEEEQEFVPDELLDVKEELIYLDEDVKEVDVYHLDGELRTVVVKEEKVSPPRPLPVVRNSSNNQSKNPGVRQYGSVLPQINILNKSAPSATSAVKRPTPQPPVERKLEAVPKSAPVPALEPVQRAVYRPHSQAKLPTPAPAGQKRPPLPVAQYPQKRIKSVPVQILPSKPPQKVLPVVKQQVKLVPTAAPRPPQQPPVANQPQKRPQPAPAEKPSMSFVKCTQCTAVFRTREYLALHEKTDHKPTLIRNTPPANAAPQPPQTSPKLPHNVKLYKCIQCNSSFIQEANFQQHLKTCKSAIALSKLNPQITVKRTGGTAPGNNSAVVQRAIADAAAERNKEDTDRIRCHYCPLTYKTKYFLKKHMHDVHKISDYDDIFYCHACKLNYSCVEDLELHNRAIHRVGQCKECKSDFRNCNHSVGGMILAGENGTSNKLASAMV